MIPHWHLSFENEHRIYFISKMDKKLLGEDLHMDFVDVGKDFLCAQIGVLTTHKNLRLENKYKMKYIILIDGHQ